MLVQPLQPGSSRTHIYTQHLVFITDPPAIPTQTNQSSHLIPINRLPLLRIQELVPTNRISVKPSRPHHPSTPPSNTYTSPTLTCVNSPLNSPLHNLISNQTRNRPVEDLIARAPESVEDGGVEHAGGGVGAVLGQAVVDYAALGDGACEACIRRVGQVWGRFGGSGGWWMVWSYLRRLGGRCSCSAEC